MVNGKMMKCLSMSRSNQRIYSVKKAVLKRFANVKGKHLCWSLFLMKSYAFRRSTLLKRDSKINFFLVKFAKFLRTPILKNICKRLLCISYDLHKYVSHVKKKLPIDLYKIYELFAKIPYNSYFEKSIKRWSQWFRRDRSCNEIAEENKVSH